MWQNGYYLDLALPALELGNDHDGAERLLLSNVHVVLHLCEHCGFKEKTWKADTTSQSCLWLEDHADQLIPDSLHCRASGQTQCFNAALPGRCTCLLPQTRVAPSLMPVWQYSTSLSRWALWFWGPWSVERSSGSPIFIFLTSSTWEKRLSHKTATDKRAVGSVINNQ